MTTPVLAITPFALIDPHKVQLAPVAATMLWPEDAVAAKAWTDACLLAHAFEEQNLDQFDAEVLRYLVRLLATRPPTLQELTPEAEIRIIDGVAAGIELLNGLGDALRGHGSSGSNNATRQRLSAFMSNADRPLVRGKRIVRTVRHFNEMSPKFRPVAHLWAAYVWSSDEGEDTFPCQPHATGDFLRLAEDLRELAERHKSSPKARGPIMKPGIGVRLPCTVIELLPASTLMVTVPENDA